MSSAFQRGLQQAQATAAEIEGAASDPAPSIQAALSLLLDQITGFVRRFVALTQAQAEVVALWLFHTHAIEAFRVTPYLRIVSAEKGSGKTILLETCSLLVSRPWLTGRVSAAVLPRKIEAECPTLLLDESDSAFGGEREYAEALRGILNTGYRRSGKTSLCVGQGASLTYRDFSTFCPKAFAGLRTLPDTVADRSIPIQMKRMAPGEEVDDPYDDGVVEEASNLRGEMERLASLSIPFLRQAKRDRLEGLSPRANEVTRPLLAVATLAGLEWSERGRRALLELLAGKGSEDESVGVRLLGDIRAVFGDSDRISSHDLCNALAEIEETPWAEWNKGKPLSPNGLARLLKPFGVVSGTIRFASGDTAKGYYRASFEDDWTRYLPAPGIGNVTTSQPASGAAFPEVSMRHTNDVVTDEKREIVNSDAPCDAVTDRGAGGRRADTPCHQFRGTGADRCQACGWESPFHPFGVAPRNLASSNTGSGLDAAGHLPPSPPFTVLSLETTLEQLETLEELEAINFEALDFDV